ncbi:MAG: hypothetical protein KJP12_03975 [Acidimicrobiia bacterium]|nr:hypothetical protein [Acidimicrobiia bacterium]
MLTDGRSALFARLIDYAGIFPPATLSMDAAVDEYRQIRTGPRAEMVGRFVCSTSRLLDLATALTRTMRSGEDPWPLCVVFDQPPSTAASTAQAFAAEMSGAATVELVEARIAVDEATAAPVTVNRLVDACGAVGPTASVFIELPFTDATAQSIGALDVILAANRERPRTVGAKIRCGPTVSAIPSVEVVASVIEWSARTRVPLKATAGLHHPVRTFNRDLGVHEHGFLNLLAALALAEEHGLDAERIAEIGGDTDAASFRLRAGGLDWRTLRAGTGTLMKMRSELFPGFGSCSFDEPADALADLGLLP